MFGRLTITPLDSLLDLELERTALPVWLLIKGKILLTAIAGQILQYRGSCVIYVPLVKWLRHLLIILDGS